ncbi:SWIM zinc finger family protein [Marinobacter vulgaris]|uniref:SWIM zinc finger family protein n=1 Tax=Marinobacter vulgaris TaxID=1928331 RepID=UPI001D0DB98F
MAGSHYQTYRTEVRFDRYLPHKVDTFCSCPVSFRCKHAVAVILQSNYEQSQVDEQKTQSYREKYRSTPLKPGWNELPRQPARVQRRPPKSAWFIFLIPKHDLGVSRFPFARSGHGKPGGSPRVPAAWPGVARIWNMIVRNTFRTTISRRSPGLMPAPQRIAWNL